MMQIVAPLYECEVREEARLTEGMKHKLSQVRDVMLRDVMLIFLLQCFHVNRVYD